MDKNEPQQHSQETSLTSQDNFSDYLLALVEDTLQLITQDENESLPNAS
jgi:hypothetical protein